MDGGQRRKDSWHLSDKSNSYIIYTYIHIYLYIYVCNIYIYIYTHYARICLNNLNTYE